MAMFWVLLQSHESEKKRKDMVEQSDQCFNYDSDEEEIIKKPLYQDGDEKLGYMCRCFILFRGALMNKDWIKTWKNSMYKYR